MKKIPSKEAHKALLKIDNYKRVRLASTKWSHSRGTIEARWTSIFLYKQICEKNETFLRPSFIYALCSIIEERINDNLINYFFSKFGEDYKRFGAVFLKLTIHEKLRVFIPIISDYKYDLLHEKKEIIAIKNLFDVRNQLIHMKNHYKLTLDVMDQDGKFSLVELDEQEATIYDEIKYKKLDNVTLTEFYDAEKQFSAWATDLHARMRRKDFRKGPWIIELKKADSSIIIRSRKKKNK